MGVALNVLSAVLAFGVPAMIALWVPQRRRRAALVLWIVSPLFVLLAIGAMDAARHPVQADPGKIAHGLALIGSFVAVPWLLACLAGFGIGSALRRKRHGASANAAPTPVPAPAPAPATPKTSPLRRASPPAALQPPSGWRAAHVGFERDGLILDGLDIWTLPWRPEASPPVTLPHPAHPGQMHAFTVYAVDDGGTATRFAAAELSNGVWGFYRWIVPADASEGRSADGSLRYAHGHGEPIGARFDALSPTATLSDARTGEILFDGRDWVSSCIVPHGDGSLVLALDQNHRETRFRIDPLRRVFRDLAQPGPDRPLRDLAAAAAEAHRDATSPANAYTGRRVAPDGSLVVELAAVEWFNTHWVHAPRVTEVATGRVLLDL